MVYRRVCGRFYYVKLGAKMDGRSFYRYMYCLALAQAVNSKVVTNREASKKERSLSLVHHQRLHVPGSSTLKPLVGLEND